MTVEKLKVLAYLGAVIIAFGAIGLVGIRYVLPALLPFAIGWAVALAVSRPSKYISGKIHVKISAVRSVIALLCVLSVLLVAGFGIFALLSEAWRFLSGATESGAVGAFFEGISSSIFGILSRLGFGEEMANSLVGSLMGVVSNAVGTIASHISSFVSGIPRAVFFLLVSSVSTVYFAIDLERINAFFKGLLPGRATLRVEEFKEKSLGIVLKYLRAYFLIMLLTFAIMFFGLSVLGVEYALLLAFVISLLDILPVIGVGVILIPAGAFMLIYGNTFLGVGLLVLAAVSYTVRQIAEPRILGKNLGIHPLLTLALMYIGYALLGIFGLVVLPVVGVIGAKFFAGRSDKNSAAEVV